jgi:hypothetical protein
MFKFKGKTESGEWVIGNHAEFVNYLDGAVRPGIQIIRQVPSSFDRFIPAFETELVEVIPETVSPGVEIDGKWYFDGDIGWDGHEYCKICFDDGCFLVYYPSLNGNSFCPSPHGHLFSVAHKIEIIGNKWDNKELLGGQNDRK